MAAIIVPARWGSLRFPGKPLFVLAGKPLIQHVWERCLLATSASRVIVATDDHRIARAARAFGADVVATLDSHPSGTDRVAEVAAGLSGEPVIVNVQGDEPFTDPDLVDRLIQALDADSSLNMATAASVITDPAELSDPNVVKVVTDLHGNALYFSRAPIPCNREGGGLPLARRHHGIYAYQRDFLLEFTRWSPTPLENLEKLEQLRALEHAAKIKVLPCDPSPPGVDTPAQAAAAEKILLGGRA